jgi:ABC-2 type transport system ATP-binding protein
MLEIKDIYYSYDKNKPVLNELNLTVEKGDFLALVGPNGSGKTTLIKLICDLLEKQQGSIKVNGIAHNDFTVKNALLYLPSDDILPEFLSGREYIKLMLNMYDRKMDQQYLERLAAFYSFESALDVLIEEYSNGMKKKIQLITAMLVDPEILIIDETLNGMDVESREITKLLLTKFSNKNKTIIMCSHDLHLLEEICNSVVILYDGKIHVKEEMDVVRKKSSLLSMFREILNHDALIDEIMSS